MHYCLSENIHNILFLLFPVLCLLSLSSFFSFWLFVCLVSTYHVRGFSSNVWVTRVCSSSIEMWGSQLDALRWVGWVDQKDLPQMWLKLSVWWFVSWYCFSCFCSVTQSTSRLFTEHNGEGDWGPRGVRCRLSPVLFAALCSCASLCLDFQSLDFIWLNFSE